MEASQPPPPPPPPYPPCATPIDFALVLDESGSMKNDIEGPGGLKAFAKELVNRYFLGADAARFSVVSFAENATTRVPWSYNAADINAGFDGMSADGKTSISDGFKAAHGSSSPTMCSEFIRAYQQQTDDGRVGATKVVLCSSRTASRRSTRRLARRCWRRPSTRRRSSRETAPPCSRGALEIR